MPPPWTSISCSGSWAGPARQIYVIGSDGDRAEHHVAWGVYRLLGHLYLVANGATPVATPWNFRA